MGRHRRCSGPDATRYRPDGTAPRPRSSCPSVPWPAPDDPELHRPQRATAHSAPRSSSATSEAAALPSAATAPVDRTRRTELISWLHRPLACDSHRVHVCSAAAAVQERSSTPPLRCPPCRGTRRTGQQRPIPGVAMVHSPGEFPDRPAPVAQGIERRFPKPCVAGSNPAGGANREAAATARSLESSAGRLTEPIWWVFGVPQTSSPLTSTAPSAISSRQIAPPAAQRDGLAEPQAALRHDVHECAVASGHGLGQLDDLGRRQEPAPMAQLHGSACSSSHASTIDRR